MLSTNFGQQEIDIHGTWQQEEPSSHLVKNVFREQSSGL
jgi:hypothetical protein